MIKKIITTAVLSALISQQLIAGPVVSGILMAGGAALTEATTAAIITTGVVTTIAGYTHQPNPAAINTVVTDRGLEHVSAVEERKKEERFVESMKKRIGAPLQPQPVPLSSMAPYNTAPVRAIAPQITYNYVSSNINRIAPITRNQSLTNTISRPRISAPSSVTKRPASAFTVNDRLENLLKLRDSLCPSVIEQYKGIRSFQEIAAQENARRLAIEKRVVESGITGKYFGHTFIPDMFELSPLMLNMKINEMHQYDQMSEELFKRRSSERRAPCPKVVEAVRLSGLKLGGDLSDYILLTAEEAAAANPIKRAPICYKPVTSTFTETLTTLTPAEKELQLSRMTTNAISHEKLLTGRRIRKLTAVDVARDLRMFYILLDEIESLSLPEVYGSLSAQNMVSKTMEASIKGNYLKEIFPGASGVKIPEGTTEPRHERKLSHDDTEHFALIDRQARGFSTQSLAAHTTMFRYEMEKLISSNREAYEKFFKAWDLRMQSTVAVGAVDALVAAPASGGMSLLTFGLSAGGGVLLDYAAELIAKEGAEAIAAIASPDNPRLCASYRKSFEWLGEVIAQHGVRAQQARQ